MVIMVYGKRVAGLGRLTRASRAGQRARRRDPPEFDRPEVTSMWRSRDEPAPYPLAAPCRDGATAHAQFTSLAMDNTSRPRVSVACRFRGPEPKEVATMTTWSGHAGHQRRTGSLRTKRRAAAVAIGTAASLAAAGCSSSGSGPAGKQVPASARQTIVFATQGLGAEGTATQAAVKAFEKLHPKIHVTILTLSPTSDVAYQQLTQHFTSGSPTPDVITSDVIWPVTFARPGWLANMNKFKPDTSAFFPGQMATGMYKGGIYAIPWFINAEGLYYRTDLIKTPPTTPAQLFKDAA